MYLVQRDVEYVESSGRPLEVGATKKRKYLVSTSTCDHALVVRTSMMYGELE